MNPDIVPECLTWKWFRAWLAKYVPEVPLDSVLPRGCWNEVRRLAETYRLQERMLEWLRTAPGDRAWVMYWARYYKLIPMERAGDD